MNIEHHIIELVPQTDDELFGPNMFFISTYELILSRQRINRIILIDLRYDALHANVLMLPNGVFRHYKSYHIVFIQYRY